jgi:hypothetical protein
MKYFSNILDRKKMTLDSPDSPGRAVVAILYKPYNELGMRTHHLNRQFLMPLNLAKKENSRAG